MLELEDPPVISTSSETPLSFFNLIPPELHEYIEMSYQGIIEEGMSVYRNQGLPELTHFISQLPSESIQLVFLHMALHVDGSVDHLGKNLLRKEVLNELSEQGVSTGIILERT
jgi:hypothetical protein